ncbi:MAG: hypothetical protein Q8P92_04170 [Candidatus Daviesbacteria bacterium]|nr:hypothetical protein [Candidatus Daviesbacteria bacterium]
MWRSKYLVLFLLLIILAGVIFQKQLSTHLKIILFITEEFPQIPVKPLGLITQSPQHEWVEFDPPAGGGKVVADLYIPHAAYVKDRSAVILAMGVKTDEKNKTLIRHFADTMARLGYVVLWPRLEVLDKGQSLPEEPATFVEGFKYLQNLCYFDLSSLRMQGSNKQDSSSKLDSRLRGNDNCEVDTIRISFVGFSAGSSIAFVASSNPEISDKVHALVFFGGYFNIFDYLAALDGETPWIPHPDAVSHAKTLLVAKGVSSSSAQLNQYSPQEFVSNFKARLFILHDKSDTFVPYLESEKLSQALPKESIGAYAITDLFEHVQPNRALTRENIQELFKLYNFLYKTLIFI